MFSVLGLLLALGILVTIHEYGHFYVARRCGVKVERFSVGFGRPIWKTTDRFGTEFAIAWIPLGGYVKMLDEREGPVAEHERDQSFNVKPARQKIAIALAGPVANFLFAIVAFSVMHVVGTRDLLPIVDQPPQGSPFMAMLERGDQIIAVDDKPVDSFSQLGLALASRVGDTGPLYLTVERNGQARDVSVQLSRWLANESSPDPLGDLGLYPKFPQVPVIIGRVEAGGAAELAGLQVGDRVVAADGEALSDWQAWVEVVRAHGGQTLAIQVQRDERVLNLSLSPVKTTDDQGETFGYVGAAAAPVDWPEDQLVTTRQWPHQAVVSGVGDTVELVQLSYQMLAKMVTGQVSLKQIGGPISMAQMAGRSIQSGFESFVHFLALISISLGIINLLPIPVLDGGHVVMHTLEGVLRRPLSERAQMIGAQLGMAFIISLMALAFINDIGRIL